MNLTTEILKNYKIFKDINDEDINNFLKIIKISNVNSNTIIAKEGNIEDRLIFLLEGKCSVSMPLILQSKLLQNDDSVKEVYKASAEDYPVFGEVFLGEAKERTANIQTTSKAIIGILEAKDFFMVCNNNTRLGYKLMKNIIDMMCDRFEKNSKTILKLSTAISLLLEK